MTGSKFYKCEKDFFDRREWNKAIRRTEDCGGLEGVIVVLLLLLGNGGAFLPNIVDWRSVKLPGPWQFDREQYQKKRRTYKKNPMYPRDQKLWRRLGGGGSAEAPAPTLDHSLPFAARTPIPPPVSANLKIVRATTKASGPRSCAHSWHVGEVIKGERSTSEGEATFPGGGRGAT